MTTAKQSAGLLVHRQGDGSIEVLLVHPGGPFWKNKDAGAWSLPKGEFGPEEAPLEVATREFREETGHSIDGSFHALEPIKQRGGKTILRMGHRSRFGRVAREEQYVYNRMAASIGKPARVSRGRSGRVVSVEPRDGKNQRRSSGITSATTIAD